MYLRPNEIRDAVFELNVNDLAFYQADMTFGAKPSDFTLLYRGIPKRKGAVL
jgi:hypothetical protein